MIFKKKLNLLAVNLWKEGKDHSQGTLKPFFKNLALTEYYGFIWKMFTPSFLVKTLYCWMKEVGQGECNSHSVSEGKNPRGAGGPGDILKLGSSGCLRNGTGGPHGWVSNGR